MNWLAYFLLTLGAVYLLTESYIFVTWRIVLGRISPFLRVLAYCRACTGFWVGLMLNPYFPMQHTLRPLLSASLVMLVGYVWSLLVENTAWTAESPLYNPTPGIERVEREDEEAP